MIKPTKKEIDVLKKYLSEKFNIQVASIKQEVDGDLVSLTIPGVSNPGSHVKYLREEYGGEFFFFYNTSPAGLKLNFSKNNNT